MRYRPRNMTDAQLLSWITAGADGRIVFNSNGCWVWVAGKSGDYGVITYQRTMLRVHVLVYQLSVGPVPEGLVLDHYVCDNPPCCNPDHVKPVTIGENVMRSECMGARWARRDSCSKGHPFTEENTHIRTDGGRKCRTCMRLQSAARRAAKKAA